MQWYNQKSLKSYRPSGPSLITNCLFVMPPNNEIYWFHSVCLTVCLSVRPASHVCSVVTTVLVGSILYYKSYQATSEEGVACKVSCKISKFEFFKICNFVLTWDLIWITSMANQGQGVSQNTGILVVVVFTRLWWHDHFAFCIITEMTSLKRKCCQNDNFRYS